MMADMWNAMRDAERLLIAAEANNPEPEDRDEDTPRPWPLDIPIGYWPRYLTPAAAAEVTRAERDGKAVQA